MLKLTIILAAILVVVYIFSRAKTDKTKETQEEEADESGKYTGSLADRNSAAKQYLTMKHSLEKNTDPEYLTPDVWKTFDMMARTLSGLGTHALPTIGPDESTSIERLNNYESKRTDETQHQQTGPDDRQ